MVALSDDSKRAYDFGTESILPKERLLNALRQGNGKGISWQHEVKKYSTNDKLALELGFEGDELSVRLLIYSYSNKVWLNYRDANNYFSGLKIQIEGYPPVYTVTNSSSFRIPLPEGENHHSFYLVRASGGGFIRSETILIGPNAKRQDIENYARGWLDSKLKSIGNYAEIDFFKGLHPYPSNELRKTILDKVLKLPEPIYSYHLTDILKEQFYSKLSPQELRFNNQNQFENNDRRKEALSALARIREVNHLAQRSKSDLIGAIEKLDWKPITECDRARIHKWRTEGDGYN